MEAISGSRLIFPAVNADAGCPGLVVRPRVSPADRGGERDSPESPERAVVASHHGPFGLIKDLRPSGPDVGDGFEDLDGAGAAVRQ